MCQILTEIYAASDGRCLMSSNIKYKPSAYVISDDIHINMNMYIPLLTELAIVHHIKHSSSSLIYDI